MSIISLLTPDRLRMLRNRLRERLWVRPLVIALLSVGAAFASKLADGTFLVRIVPPVTPDSIERLLSIMAASMLVIATFAVASMVSAYASASSVATPRSFPLVVSDDVSQNALSTFVGAFIFSIVALTAVENRYFEQAGLFCLFVLTVIAFGAVIFTFVRWVDRIARLGRLGATVDKVERAAEQALRQRRDLPTLCGRPLAAARERGTPVYGPCVGYVQNIDITALQTWAEEADAQIEVGALPGTFAAPGKPLAWVRAHPATDDLQPIAAAFQIGDDRRFEDDPRFGLVVLSEIAGRALSPAVNDPGTAIDIIGTFVRLFVLWGNADATPEEPRYDRIGVPEVATADMFDDAFTAIARDGAGIVEVGVRLQKGLEALASLGDAAIHEAAVRHARTALTRAEHAMSLPADLETVRAAAAWLPAASDG